MKGFYSQAKELTQKLTLKEKIGQIAQIAIGYRCYTVNKDGKIEFTDEFKQIVRDYGGIGAISGILRADPWSERNYETGVTLELRDKIANKLQAYLEENTRMKIPALIEIEASHGMQSLGSATYPTGLACAASFNEDLYGKMMNEIGKEIEASGNHVAFLTLIDLSRDPRWGRSEECLGEDPYLASRMAESAVKNIKKSNVLACAKHFAGAGPCDGGINAANVSCGKRELEEVGLPTARACVDAGCDVLMVAYNSIDGELLHSNRKILTEELKERWGFDGIVLSDGTGVSSVARNLDVSREDAAALCLNAGIDLSLEDMGHFTELENALANGKVDISRIDDACARVIQKKLELDLFNRRYVKEGADVDFNKDGHCQAVAREMAEECVTMIKNDRTLPLDKVKKVAVVGENAEDIYHTLGDYTSYHKEDEGTTLYGAIKKSFPDAYYVKGWDFNVEYSEEEAQKTISALSDADAIIFSAGGTSKRDFDTKFTVTGAMERSDSFMDCGEGADSANILLPQCQLKLLKKLKESGKPIVSVVFAGRAYVLNELEALSDAVLIAWYPGQEGGFAIADILTGKVNPSGKLPVSLPSSVGVLPVCHDSYARTYRYIDCEQPVLHSFGFGLSYSKFVYGDLKIEKTPTEIVASFSVKNDSAIAGKEVAQIFVTPSGDATRHREHLLKGYRKFSLNPGEEKRIEFRIPYGELGFVAPISPKVEISIGSASDEKFERIKIELDKEALK